MRILAIIIFTLLSKTVSAQISSPDIIKAVFTNQPPLLISGNEEANKDWNGVWDARTFVTNEGWFAEIRIPFNSLQFKKDAVYNLKTCISVKQCPTLYLTGKGNCKRI
jgi:hypothetical protein